MNATLVIEYAKGLYVRAKVWANWDTGEVVGCSLVTSTHANCDDLDGISFYTGDTVEQLAQSLSDYASSKLRAVWPTVLEPWLRATITAFEVSTK